MIGSKHTRSVPALRVARARPTSAALLSVWMVLFLSASGLAIVPRKAPDRPADAPAASGRKPETDGDRKPAAAPADGEPAAEPETGTTDAESPRLEIYVPSVAALADAAARSHSGRLWKALQDVLALPERETDEEFDFSALLRLLGHVRSWPDTSLTMAVYTQDEEGRPRWSVRLDWPLADLRKRTRAILDDEAAKRLLENVALRGDAADGYRIELPDVLLCVLLKADSGSVVSSAADLRPPLEVFGRPKTTGGAAQRSRRPALVYCRLNLETGKEGGGVFDQLSFFKDVRYILDLPSGGAWRERFSLRWNPFIGMGLKTAVKRVRDPFDCPGDALAVAAFNAGGAQIADGLADLPSGTLSRRVRDGTACVVAPSDGFVPLPEVFFEMGVRTRKRVIEDVRTAIAEDRRKRAEDERRPAWHEETLDGQPVFWRDPTADESANLSIATYRTVVFLTAPDGAKDDAPESRLIIAYTPQWAEDAVAGWKRRSSRRRDRVRLPSAENIHWQARLNWRALYAQVQPYLTLASSVTGDASAPPDPDDLADALVDSVIDLRIEIAGLRMQHVGPVPVGAVYVPSVAAAALASGDDAGSESQRLRLACRQLRVLHHHAKLFRDDYGRWPATVAELDGYVDFASHPYLLSIRPQQRDFLGGLARFVSGRDEQPQVEPGGDIDDSLYEIEWSPDQWKLKFRAGEFKEFATLYIDQEGEIHRVPPADETAAAAGAH